MADATATINLDSILSPEQRQKLAEEVWKENEETIKNGIRKALHHELQSDIVNRARALLSTEFQAMVRVVIKEKLPEVERTLNEIVMQMIGFEETAMDSLSEVAKDYLDTFTQTAGNRLAEALRRGVNKALEKGQLRYFEMRARRQRGERDSG